jgi:regulatory protein
MLSWVALRGKCRCCDEPISFMYPLVELIVVRLKDRGYLNDAKFAAAYSSFRLDNEKFGRRRVITDLKIKGFHGEVIEKAVDSA